MYPDDDTALLNAAASTLERRELISAEKYLAKIKTHSPEYNNCMGVLMMLQEDYNQAESFFKRAGGLVEASQNLLELQKKRDNMELLK